LVIGEKQVGLYNLGSKLSGSAYNRDEVHLLRLIGRQAAVAVENSRLFRAEQDQRKLAQALQEAADVVSSTLDSTRCWITSWCRWSGSLPGMPLTSC